MIDRIRSTIGRIHAEQSGAIALMLLASILILFMTALVIFDAGTAAQDKMDVQIGADSAAFSHSIVKARSMNMIAYANTVKRMIFSYLATYINAWLAILARWAYHASRCFRIFPDISSCITWALAIPMIIAEGIEFIVTNMPTMGGWPLWMGDAPRSRSEIKALENYQEYMFAITPWWAYVEGALRGMMNGAMITAAWPPPGSVLSGINSAIAPIIGPLDGALGTNVMGMLPGSTSHTDVLPISRRDIDDTWNNVNDPWNYDNDMGFGHARRYCEEYDGSFEWFTTGAQTFITGMGDDPDGWEWTFAIMHIIPWSVGCLFASWSYKDDNFVDWRLKSSNGNNKQNWLAATGSLHIAYLPRAGRNDSSTGERQKYMYMSREATLSNNFKNEGYFGMARSEIVYKQPVNWVNPLESLISSIPIFGSLLTNRLGINHEPDMWSPRWTSKNRPVTLPGERFGSAISTTTVGLNVVTRDAVPFLALGSLIGLVGPQGGDPPFSIPSAVRDFYYLLRAGQTFGTSQIEGIPK
jgi:hypothetical protein